jgi:hypothetical protein
MEILVKKQYRNYNLVFECGDFDDCKQWLDTVVSINGTYLCTIAGSDIDSFVRDFENVVNTYRI